jgi:hypothetical protein
VKNVKEYVWLSRYLVHGTRYRDRRGVLRGSERLSAEESERFR